MPTPPADAPPAPPEPPPEPPSRAERLSGWIVGGLRFVARRVPPKLRKDVEDRIFYAIFQMTRVENDAYGWRPRAKEPPDT